MTYPRYAGAGSVKKGHSLLCEPPQMIYAFISKQKDYTVAKWAAFFGVSGSGYYGWIQNKESRIKREEQYAKAVKEASKSGEGTYGVERVCGVMRRFERTASYDKVARHIKAMGLKSIHNRRRQWSLTDSRNARDDTYPNLIRGLEITEPFQVVTSDYCPKKF